MLFHREDKNKPAITMELKTIGELENETKDGVLESALKKIERLDYEVEAKKRWRKEIHKFGVVFGGERGFEQRESGKL